jgi:predicted nucleic acid-binding protein
MGVRCRGPSLFLSAIVILEPETGVLLAEEERSNPRRGSQGVAGRPCPRELSQRILPVDVAVAQRYAKLQVPDPCSDRDALMAATAFVHGMTVVTVMGAHCEPIGVGVLNP